MIQTKFLSSLINVYVFDQQGKKFGKIKDFVATLSDDFIHIIALKIKNSKEYIIPLEEVKIIAQKFFFLKNEDQETKQLPEDDSYILLVRDILDKQIIDTEGIRIVRVNDLKITYLENKLIVLGADVSFLGLLRRLKVNSFFEKFLSLLGYNIDEKTIPWSNLEPLDTELSHLRLNISHKKLHLLHPSDIADIISQLSSKERLGVFNSLDLKIAAETLHELEPEVQADIIEDLKEEKASDILELMPSDEAADVLADLPEHKVRNLLKLMEQADAQDVERLLHYDENVAGGLMTTEFIFFPSYLTAQETIEKIRELAPSAETIYYLYIINEEQKLVGVLSLRDLIVANPQTVIESIMRKKIIKINTACSLDIIKKLFSKYNLLALPVVDEIGKLVGIITVDDIVDVMYPPLSRRKQKKWG